MLISKRISKIFKLNIIKKMEESMKQNLPDYNEDYHLSVFEKL
jgi:hypothetical protein